MGIEHRLTVPYSPQTNGIVERMNGRIVENIFDKIQFKSNEELENVLKKYLIEYIKKNYPHLNLDSLNLYNQVECDKYLKTSKICIIHLPSYSTNLNLIERLWNFLLLG